MAIKQSFTILSTDESSDIDVEPKRLAAGINGVRIAKSASSALDLTLDQAADLITCLKAVIANQKAVDSGDATDRLLATRRNTSAFPDDK